MFDDIGPQNREYEFAERWWLRFRDTPPSITNATTQQLLDNRVLTLSQAFKAGLPMGVGTYKVAKAVFLSEGKLSTRSAT